MQHQSTDVQISDILTKDLGKIKHKEHRRVLFGLDPIRVVSVALPESQKVYVRRHNEELAQRVKTQELKAKFDSPPAPGSHGSQQALVAALQALLGLVSS